MTSRLLALFVSACACALPAAADLEIALPDPRAGAVTRKAQPSPKKKSPKPLPKKPVTRGNLSSRSGAPLRQVGVARRGSIPVLPSVGADMAPAGAAAPTGQVPVTARLGRALAGAVSIFRLPDAQSTWLGKLKQGQQVAIVSQWQGWWSIVMADGSQGYVPQSHVELLPFQVRSVTPAAPASSAAQPPASQMGAAPLQTVSYVGAARSLIEEAYRYMGTPYVYGGNSESGIDCSGLVKNCFSTLGIQLPRRASEQARVGAPVPLTDLQPGDRLYFSVKKQHDHTGIYLGDGYFIHAASSRGKVTVDHLSTRLYGNNLETARR
ncbi:MAG: NlpC/P60 family protein [Actinomycetota bacterium]